MSLPMATVNQARAVFSPSFIAPTPLTDTAEQPDWYIPLGPLDPVVGGAPWPLVKQELLSHAHSVSPGVVNLATWHASDLQGHRSYQV